MIHSTVGYITEPKKKRVRKWSRKSGTSQEKSPTENNLVSVGPGHNSGQLPQAGSVPPSPGPPPHPSPHPPHHPGTPGLHSPLGPNACILPGQQGHPVQHNGPSPGHPMGPPLPHMTGHPHPGSMPHHHGPHGHGPPPHPHHPMHPHHGPSPGMPAPHPPPPPHHMPPHPHMHPHPPPPHHHPNHHPGMPHPGHMPHGMPHLPPDGRGHGPGPPPGHLMMDPHHHPHPHHPGRHTPYFSGNAEFKIYEMNKRLQQRSDESDNLWWDAFATEFFEEDASLTLTFCLEDGPKRYSIGRTLIPRYFRSVFEGGVTDLSFHLKHPKETFQTSHLTLDCELATMITSHGKIPFNKMNQYDPSAQMKDQMVNKDNSVIVCTEGRLTLDFAFDDMMRIKSWHFATRQHQELIPRSIVAIQASQDPSSLEQMSKNITRQGLTNSTLNYLRLCVILEPMQELMSRHKAYSLSPRDCLKTTLFQKWQKMVAPPEQSRPPGKRRKRKSSATNNAGSGGGKKKGGNNTMSPGPPNFSLASQDVMVVGEPSLMGGEFGDEDERLITRLENNQYDPNASGPSNGLEGDPGDFSGLGAPLPVSGAPGVSNSGPWPPGPSSGPATSNPGSGPPSADSRTGGSSGSNGPPDRPEDKKSPLSQ